jgi:hypothetical protein
VEAASWGQAPPKDSYGEEGDRGSNESAGPAPMLILPLCFYLICFFFCPRHIVGLRPRGYPPSKGSGVEECGRGRGCNGSAGTSSILIISFVFLFDQFLKFLYHLIGIHLHPVIVWFMFVGWVSKLPVASTTHSEFCKQHLGAKRRWKIATEKKGIADRGGNESAGPAPMFILFLCVFVWSVFFFARAISPVCGPGATRRRKAAAEKNVVMAVMGQQVYHPHLSFSLFFVWLIFKISLSVWLVSTCIRSQFDSCSLDGDVSVH